MMNFTSGYGQYHTDNPNTKTPKPYLKITSSQIDEMVQHPPSNLKKDAQWVLFTNTQSREASRLKKDAQFTCLWVDVDETNISFSELVAKAKSLFKCKFIAYTTSSATQKKTKARLIIPLRESCDGITFQYLQTVINNMLEAIGIKADRATERVNQICYLPNKASDFYEYYIANNFPLISWKEQLHVPLANLVAVEQCKQEQQKILMEDARQRASNRISSGAVSPIDAFNKEISIELLFTQYGYKKVSNRWLSPLSGSGQAGVIINTQGLKWISTHQSDIDSGLGSISNKSCFGDAFDLFTFFENDNDKNKAIKSAGDMFTINGHNLTNANQMNYMEKKLASEDGIIPIKDRPDWLRGDILTEVKLAPEPVQKSSVEVKPLKTLSFADFSLNSKVDEMKRQMADDVFILNDLALQGQITIFYASPNTGKTLAIIRFLIDAVKCGNIKGEDVYYINADDNYRGLVTKTEILNEYDIRMLAPSHNDFTKDHVEPILNSMTIDGSAKGKVIIIDTLKKFADLMDKRMSSNFMDLLRQFVSKGGSVILLAHTNKHTDADGKPVFQGTSDSRDDADCCYTIQLVDTNTTSYRGDKKITKNSILFENIKSRGDVAQSKSFHYEKVEGGDYQSILDSFEDLDEDKALKLKEIARINEQLKEDADHIDCVIDGFKAGVIKKTDIIQRLVENQGLSKPKARKIIDTHVGGDYLKGHRWTCVKGGDRNVKIYSKLKPTY